MSRLTLAARHTLPWLCAALPALGAAATPAAVLDEIVVTARRQATPAIETPLSLDRLDAVDIALVGATHSSEAINRVPGAMVQRGSGQESLPAIRSPVLTGAGSCGAFLFLENGVPIRPTGFCNVNELLEINTEQADAIEILRGTGTALYGSNSVHGTINVLHDAPAQLPRTQLGLMLGPSDYYRVGMVAAHDGPRADSGLKAFYAHDGGWRDDSGFEEGKLNATLAVGADSSLPARIDLAATRLDQETAGFILGEDAYRDASLSRTNPNPEAYRNVESARLTALLQPATSLPGQLELRPYARYSRMDFLQHFLPGQPVERNGQQSLGLMTTVDWNVPARASLTTGIDLEWADSFLLEDQQAPTIGSRPTGRHYDYTVVSNVAAAYGQFEYAVRESLHFGAGLRLEYVGYDYDNRMLAGNTDANGVPCAGSGCLYTRPADRHDSFTNAAPKLSLRWTPAPGWMLYANASRGFRPPEMTELYRLQRGQSVADLDSEQVDALELGVKTGLDDWQVELAAFDMRKRNVILRDASGYNVSNGRTTHAGLEYQVTWQPVEQIEARLGGTYARHEYDFSTTIEGGETIEDGADVDTAPRELLRVALGYTPWPTLSTEAEWLVVGDYYVDASNAHRYDGHELLNLRAKWDFAARWSATVRVNNTLDTAYADRADYAFGSYRYFPGRPRSVFVELAWSAR